MTKAGFTLIEVLLSLTLSTVLMGLLFLSIDTGFRVVAKGKRLSHRTQVTRALLDLIADDLSNCNGQVQGSEQQIRIVREMQITAQPSNVIEYRCVTDAAIPLSGGPTGRGVYRRPQLGVSQNEKALRWEPLDQKNAELRFQYFDGKAWTREWLEPGRPLRAIRVQVKIEGSEQSLVVRIPNGA